ncbi:unnamed protein product [Didymodactylos carnosus]|uniref:Copper radical oxidase n=1 Tax=Didymodactylos carnosus TaxID=1234261 RepID=A0A816CZ25_9BILA|nr:unnamed protein product [Didymodactylos carnosus]CAF4528221.1 unnamed protein product [Didymodactylos carnosus]
MFRNTDGRQSIRFYTPGQKSHSFKEWSHRIHLTVRRWYPGMARLDDGSVLIGGGCKYNTLMNNKTNNQPSWEFYPPKNINGHRGTPIHSPFLVDSLNANLFPHLISLTNGNVFVAAQKLTMIYNWRKNKETRLPSIPNGVSVTYPLAGTAIMLPLTKANKYTPEILICGGSAINDTLPPSKISSEDPASKQCVRMKMTKAGIKKGWVIEQMPEARLMPDAVHLPDGTIFIVNGAQSGVQGIGGYKDRFGTSDADNPVYTPVLYNPNAPIKFRFNRKGFVSSTIARMYHSSASLTANGTIMIAGSNPNIDITTTTKYPTEYRVEFFYPPYMFKRRPSYSNLPAHVHFNKNYILDVQLPSTYTNHSRYNVQLMDLGLHTHAVGMHLRSVELDAKLINNNQLVITMPKNGKIYPPGPGFIFFVVDGVPSKAEKTIVVKNKP